MANMYSFPGLAASTGTRVDSQKHNIACRLHEALMMTWCANQDNARNHMHTHKMKYCMHKDELALNCGQPLNDTSTVVNPTRAYPMVVTNLGDMSHSTKQLLRWLYNDSRTGTEWLNNKDLIRDLCRVSSQHALQQVFGNTDRDNKTKVLQEITNMPYFTAQGYALGIAYASTLSGDNVGTVMIGGMQTVMNGAFECRAGQPVQWYFDFEVDCFHEKSGESGPGKRLVAVGMRKDERLNSATGHIALAHDGELKTKGQLSTVEEKRREYHERALGMANSYPEGGNSAVKRNIAYPKPYVLRTDGNEHYADKIRVFAKCITGARKFEMMDIMLMTQSL
jgi:hypothetical protein